MSNVVGANHDRTPDGMQDDDSESKRNCRAHRHLENEAHAQAVNEPMCTMVADQLNESHELWARGLGKVIKDSIWRRWWQYHVNHLGLANLARSIPLVTYPVQHTLLVPVRSRPGTTAAQTRYPWTIQLQWLEANEA